MNKQELSRFVERQIENILCFKVDVAPYIDTALRRTALCIEKSASKHMKESRDSEVLFSVYNSVQYCVFLYYLSNTAFAVDKSGIVAEKIYYLNRVLNSVDLFYEIELPKIFGVEHPLGSVMGRAKYSDYLFFYQGCTVGGSGGNYPTIGRNVLMYSNSKILGDALIGNNVIISANTYIKDCVIPDNCIVFGQSPNIVIKQRTEREIHDMTKHIWRATE